MTEPSHDVVACDLLLNVSSINDSRINVTHKEYAFYKSCPRLWTAVKSKHV